MKARRLLLTPEEHYMAWGSSAEISSREKLGIPDKRGLGGSSQAICRAQVAKALDRILREAKRTEATTYAQNFIQRVIRETGLTWPVKAKGR